MSNTKVEKRLFEDYLGENVNTLPDKKIVSLINENLHPFNRNEFFSKDAPLISSKEFLRCYNLHNRRCENKPSNPMEILKLMQVISTKEHPIKEELQNLAINLVRDMYNVPDEIDLKAMLELDNVVDGDCDSDVYNISDERKEELQEFIEKRRILNSLVHGCAVYQWTDAYYIVQDELNELDETLIEDYNNVSAMVNYWNWLFYFGDMFDMGHMPMTQGINIPDVENKEIKASAINFPVLIHELSKGVIDYITQAGIPNFIEDGVSTEEVSYILEEADKYSHEQWHYFFGPTLWKSLIEASDVGAEGLIPIIRKMSELKYDDLKDFCIDIVFYADTLGKKSVNKLKQL
jgi:hypothetical protein